MKFVLLSLLAGVLPSCGTQGFSKRAPGDPAKLEVTLEQSVTNFH
jgi:hypothetical protein